MIFDALLTLSGSVSATGVITGQAANGAGSILGTNTIDLATQGLGGTPQIPGIDTPALQVSFSVLTAPTVGTSVQFQLIQADDAALSSNVQVITQTDAVPIASLPAGTIFSLRAGSGVLYPKKRYFGVRYVNVGAIATLSVFASLVTDQQVVKGNILNTGFAIA